MDWDKLRIFHAVAEAGSFTAAGNSLNLNQSSVSRQINSLEESLDVILFHRHPRGLVLTEQGEILKKAVSDIFTKLSLIEGQLSDTKDLAEGPLKITVSDFIGSTWLAPKLKDFRVSYPSIQLTILFEDRILNLGMREADAALRLRKSKQVDLIQRHLTQVHFYMCASTDYIEEYGRPEKAEDLKNHCLIGFPIDTYAPFKEPNWLFEFAEVDVQHNYNLLMMNSMYSIHRAVVTGAGIALLPDHLIRARSDLEIIMPDVNRPAVDLYFVYAEERRHSQRIGALREFLLRNISAKTL